MEHQITKAKDQEQQKSCCLDTSGLHDRKRGTRCCGNSVVSGLGQEEARKLSDDLQVLAHPMRLQILDMLARHGGQVCVCDLEAALPVKQPTVSHHLKLLCDAGYVDFERHGLWSFYFIRKEALARFRERISQQLQVLG